MLIDIKYTEKIHFHKTAGEGYSMSINCVVCCCFFLLWFTKHFFDFFSSFSSFSVHQEKNHHLHNNSNNNKKRIFWVSSCSVILLFYSFLFFCFFTFRLLWFSASALSPLFFSFFFFLFLFDLLSLSSLCFVFVFYNNWCVNLNFRIDWLNWLILSHTPCMNVLLPMFSLSIHSLSFSSCKFLFFFRVLCLLFSAFSFCHPSSEKFFFFL